MSQQVKGLNQRNKKINVSPESKVLSSKFTDKIKRLKRIFIGEKDFPYLIKRYYNSVSKI